MKCAGVVWAGQIIFENVCPFGHPRLDHAGRACWVRQRRPQTLKLVIQGLAGLGLGYISVVELTNRRAAAQVPFRDDTLMVGPPSCTLEDFKMPRLRRCPFELASLTWEARLGGGLDGYAWKVRCGDEGPFVLNVIRTVIVNYVSHHRMPGRHRQQASHYTDIVVLV